MSIDQSESDYEKGQAVFERHGHAVLTHIDMYKGQND